MVRSDWDDCDVAIAESSLKGVDRIGSAIELYSWLRIHTSQENIFDSRFEVYSIVRLVEFVPQSTCCAR